MSVTDCLNTGLRNEYYDFDSLPAHKRKQKPREEPWPKRKFSTRRNDDRFAGHRGGSAKKALAARRMASGTERYEMGRSPASRAVISRVTIAGMAEAFRLREPRRAGARI